MNDPWEDFKLSHYPVLWDLRGRSPEARRLGIGSDLFAATERWAIARGCRQLKVETQNVNVAACEFYSSRGCQLGAIHRFAYPDLPHEVQFLWYKNLVGSETAEGASGKGIAGE